MAADIVKSAGKGAYDCTVKIVVGELGDRGGVFEEKIRDTIIPQLDEIQEGIDSIREKEWHSAAKHFKKAHVLMCHNIQEAIKELEKTEDYAMTAFGVLKNLLDKIEALKIEISSYILRCGELDQTDPIKKVEAVVLGKLECLYSNKTVKKEVERLCNPSFGRKGAKELLRTVANLYMDVVSSIFCLGSATLLEKPPEVKFPDRDGGMSLLSLVQKLEEKNRLERSEKYGGVTYITIYKNVKYGIENKSWVISELDGTSYSEESSLQMLSTVVKNKWRITEAHQVDVALKDGDIIQNACPLLDSLGMVGILEKNKEVCQFNLHQSELVEGRSEYTPPDPPYATADDVPEEAKEEWLKFTQHQLYKVVMDSDRGGDYKKDELVTVSAWDWRNEWCTATSAEKEMKILRTHLSHNAWRIWGSDAAAATVDVKLQGDDILTECHQQQQYKHKGTLRRTGEQCHFIVGRKDTYYAYPGFMVRKPYQELTTKDAVFWVRSLKKEFTGGSHWSIGTLFPADGSSKSVIFPTVCLEPVNPGIQQPE